MQLIQTITLNSTTTSITFSNIPQTYNHLAITMFAIGSGGGNGTKLRLSANSTNATGGSYYLQETTSVSSDETNVPFAQSSYFGSAKNNNFGYFPFYTHDQKKFAYAWSAGDFRVYATSSSYYNTLTSAVTSLTFQPESDQLYTGTTISLYGIGENY